MISGCILFNRESSESEMFSPSYIINPPCNPIVNRNHEREANAANEENPLVRQLIKLINTSSSCGKLSIVERVGPGNNAQRRGIQNDPRNRIITSISSY